MNTQAESSSLRFAVADAPSAGTLLWTCVNKKMLLQLDSKMEQ
jgi:hypothetical protein